MEITNIIADYIQNFDLFTIAMINKKNSQSEFYCQSSSIKYKNFIQFKIINIVMYILENYLKSKIKLILCCLLII